MTAALVITDHAVLRFMERVMGLDVEAVRARIAAIPGLAAAAAAGATHVSIDGFTYSLKDRDTLTTVTPGRTPTGSIRSGYSAKHGRSTRGRTNSAMEGRERGGGRHDRAFDGGGE